MARRRTSSFSRAIEAQARAQQKAARDVERAQRAAVRIRIANEKERKRQYSEDRISEVQEMNQDLELEIQTLERLLMDSLGRRSSIDFKSLKVKAVIPTLDLGDFKKTISEPTWGQFEPKKPNFLIAWIPAIKKGHESNIAMAQETHQLALKSHAEKEKERRDACERKIQEHKLLGAILSAKAEKTNSKIDQWKADIEAGDRESIESYFDQVLEESDYPDGFPQEAKFIYVPESKQLILEYDLPEMDEVIPTVKAYSYVKTSDTISESTRPEKQRRVLYASVAAQTTLRCIYELFTSDQWGLVDTIVLNGFVATTDPGTGKPIRPCLVTVRTTKDRFMDLNLAAVDPIAALQNLSASFSKSPAELTVNSSRTPPALGRLASSVRPPTTCEELL